MKREHRVPLSFAAMDILKAMKQGERVFKLSDMALTTLIRRMHGDELKQGRKGFLDPKMNKVAVPHGFRSRIGHPKKPHFQGKSPKWPSPTLLKIKSKLRIGAEIYSRSAGS